MLNFERALKNIGDWISKETELRKYPKGELLELSESLQVLNAAIARQTVKSEEVQEAISWAKVMEILYEEKQMPECADCAKTAVAALQEYQPWVSVSNVKPEKSGRYIAYVPEHWTDDSHKEAKTIVAYFREVDYDGNKRVWFEDGYRTSGEVTHYLPLPEPPKGE